MDRKTILVYISILAVLALAITVSVVVLYSDFSPEKDAETVLAEPRNPVLRAVPSDASLIESFPDFQSAFRLLAQPGSLFSRILEESYAGNHLYRFLSGLASGSGGQNLKGGATVISFHYSGRPEPLLLVETGASADTSRFAREMMRMADSCGLSYALFNCGDNAVQALRKKSILALSASETLVNSSGRHLRNGSSILDREDFLRAAASAGNGSDLFISHEYGVRTLPPPLRSMIPGKASVFSDFAVWTVMSLERSEGESATFSGRSLASKNERASFVSVTGRSGKCGSSVASVAPSGAVSALAYSFSDIHSWIGEYKTFLDANGRLDRYIRSTASSAGNGTSPEEWAEGLDIKEIARVDIPSGEGLAHILYVRTGKVAPEKLEALCACPAKADSGLVFRANPFPGYAARVFGSSFDVNDSLCVYRNGWIAFSGERIPPFQEEFTLERRLRDAGSSLVRKDAGVMSYMAPSQDAVSVLTFGPSGGRLEIIRSDALIPKVSAAADAGFAVNVPEGPFRVRNSGTGRINIFSQSANGSLSLKEENGKSLWAIPFGGKLCGSVQEIDYYANGKIQYLFASGDALYLIDRLGRFVSPFPVKLGGEVLLGPAVYDFTGAHAYTAMVLHSDNTVGMYDLRGRLKEGWAGIAPESPLVSVPELIEFNGRKLWAVRTAVELLFYDFMGGEPLTSFSGNRRISPATEIELRGDGISVTCVDGKVRKIKL